MAYNGSNQYSPYYQSQGNNYQTTSSVPQTDSNQYQDDSRLNTSYSSNSYQPLSAYQSDYQRQQQQEQNNSTPTGYTRGISYSNQSYGNLPTSSAEQNLNTSYSSSRPDTSALGNLAYASSLGQNSQSSLAQLIEFNRARGNSSYKNSESYNNDSQVGGKEASQPASFPSQQTSHNKAYSNPAGNFSDQTQQPRADIAQSSMGSSAPAQYQYSNQRNQQSSYQAQPQTHPAGNRVATASQPNSQASYQSSRSPQLSNNQAHQVQQNDQSNAYMRQSQGVQQGHRPSPSTTPATSKSLSKPPTYAFAQPAKNNASRKTSAGNAVRSPTVATSAVTSSNEGPSHVQGAQENAGKGQQSPQIPAETPTTVDPSQIFNNYEYQRRQTEKEAARKKVQVPTKATETPQARQGTKAKSRGGPAGDDVAQAARALMQQSGSTSSGGSAANTEEEEIKAMIEKMKNYKAKNPELFSQVWEEAKQSTPAQKETPKARGSSTKKALQHSEPSPTIEKLPTDFDPATSAFPDGFDRGRYPKERRRRGPNVPKLPPSKQNHKKKSAAELNAQYKGFQDISTENLDPALTDMVKPAIGPSVVDAQPTKLVEQPKDHASSPNPAQKRPIVPGGNTIWPEDRKRALAEAAVANLMAIPSNRGRTIYADEIHQLLNENPSYNELCEYLERRGFVVQRGPFARQLLKAVPDAQSSQNPAPAAAPQAVLQTMVQAQPPQNHVAPVGFMSPAQMTSFSAYTQPPSQAGFSPYPLNQQSIKAESPAVPLTKAEKARKRNISDIVDLTAFEEEDAFLRHRPKPRIESKAPVPQTEVTKSEPAGNGTNHGAFRNFRLDQANKAAQPPKSQLQQATSRGNPREGLLYEMIAEPMNKRRDALRRSQYDSRSIARDILLATGKHPTLTSLNVHLDKLRDRFLSVDQNTDLSTFHWDLVDPGGPAGPKPVSLLMKEYRENRENDNSAATADAKASALRQGLAGRGNVPSPSVQAVNHPPKPTSNAFGPVPGPKRRGRPRKNAPSDSQSLGATQSTTAASNGTKPSQLYSSAIKASASDSAAVFEDASRKPTDFEDGPLTSLDFSQNTPSEPASTSRRAASIRISSESPATTPVRVPGRKGRPPGAKNKQPRPDKGIPKRRSLANTESDNSPVSSIEIKQETETPSGHPPARPSGLRNVMTPTATGGVSVVIPSRSPSVVGASPSSGRRDANQVETKHGGTRNSTPFKCRWEGCGAEYPKIDPLRRHVRKTHREDVGAVGPWPCLWADCYNPLSRNRPRRDSSSEDESDDEEDEDKWQPERMSFTDAERWDRHVERKHIAQYLPGASLAEPDDIASAPYISDSSGRRVTPIASPSPSQPTDPLPLNTDPAVMAEYHLAHDQETDEDQHDAQVRALVAKKERIGGMGIYKTGMRLASPRQRAALAKGSAQKGGRIETVGGSSDVGSAREDSDEAMDME